MRHEARVNSGSSPCDWRRRAVSSRCPAHELPVRDVRFHHDSGFVPFLGSAVREAGDCPSTDPRYLGAMIHVVPEYTDADDQRRVDRGCTTLATACTWVTAGEMRARQWGTRHTTWNARRMARKVTKAIHDFNLIEDGDRVMVGLSGGKDSWALIQILDVLRKRAPISFSHHRRQHRFGVRRLPARHHQGHLRCPRLGVPRGAHDHRRSDGRHPGRERDPLLALRAPAQGRPVPAGGQSGRHEDCARAITPTISSRRCC